MGLFDRKGFFQSNYLVPSTRRVDPHRIPVYKLLPDSPFAVAHDTAAGHFLKQLTPTHPFPEDTLVV